MKIKKLLSIIFVLMLMFAFCVAFTACDDEETHVHTFSDSLTNDSTHHWYPATCEHTEEVKDKVEHTFGEWQTVEDSTCAKQGKKTRACACGYAQEELLPLSTQHTFGNDGKCTVCQYYNTLSEKEIFAELITSV